MATIFVHHGAGKGGGERRTPLHEPRSIASFGPLVRTPFRIVSGKKRVLSSYNAFRRRVSDAIELRCDRLHPRPAVYVLWCRGRQQQLTLGRHVLAGRPNAAQTHRVVVLRGVDSGAAVQSPRADLACSRVFERAGR